MKLLFTTLLLAFSLTAFGRVQDYQGLKVAPALVPLVNKILLLPEMKKNMEYVLSEGPITIRCESKGTSGFNAMWNGTDREIIVNNSPHRTEGKMICSILFELHNAKTDRTFMSLINSACRGTLSKAQYVEGVERMEYQNALEASTLLNKGIRQGIFSYDSYWPIARTFNEHFSIQKRMGHSDFIAQSYDNFVRANYYTYR